MDYGNVVRSLRAIKGMTQVQLSEKTRISRSTIQAIEHGNHVPQKYTVDQIAKAFGMTFEELFILALSDKTESKNIKQKYIDLLSALSND